VYPRRDNNSMVFLHKLSCKTKNHSRYPLRKTKNHSRYPHRVATSTVRELGQLQDNAVSQRPSVKSTEARRRFDPARSPDQVSVVPHWPPCETRACDNTATMKSYCYYIEWNASFMELISTRARWAKVRRRPNGRNGPQEKIHMKILQKMLWRSNRSG